MTEVAVRDEGVTAAASPLSLDGTTWRSWKLGDNRWQMEAWRHFDICGELRFATNWMANAISRCRLYVAEVDKQGRPGKESSDPAIQVLAETMFGGQALKAEAQRAIGAQLYVSGESYIIAEDAGNANKDIWYVCSTSEVHRYGSQRILVDRSNIYGGGQHELRKGRDLMMRVWTPHPRRYDAADSSVRAALPILREIEGLTKKVFAQIDSRLAGAGMMFLPQELDFPRTDKDPPGARGLMALLQRNIAAALQDQSAASALVPVMAQVPGELIDKIKWLTFETPFQAETAEKLEQAIRRLATALDIPPEVLLGQGDTNHWSAWQIEESTIKIQVEPVLVRMVDALTGGYLRAALTAIGKDPDAFVVWYDTAALAVRPNRQADAIALYGANGELGIISAEEVRKSGDWGESAKPSKKEYEQRLAQKMVGLNPALISNADIQKALGIDWKIEDPNAAQPGMPPEEGAPVEQPAAPEQAPASDGWLMGTDERALPAAPGMEAALLVGADLVVKRALERAGARLLTRARRTSGEFAAVPVMQLHTRIPVGPEEIGRCLGDAFDDAAAELAARVGMDPSVVTDMLTVYTTSLMAQGEPHDYGRFSLYVDQALDLIGHGQCGQFCRNPLHPGPCAGFKGPKIKKPSTRAPRTDEPSAGPGKKKQITTSTPPKDLESQIKDVRRAVAAKSGGAKPKTVVKNGDKVIADMAIAENDREAQARLVQAAHETYGFTDPGTGITATVVEVAPEARRTGEGSTVRVRISLTDQQGKKVGTATRLWRPYPGGDGKIEARHLALQLDENIQGGGFSRRWNAQVKQGYQDMGLARITTHANDTVGGAAWAAEGYDFYDEPSMTDVADRFRRVTSRMTDGDPIKAQLDALIIRSTAHDFAAGTHPSPYEWYMVGHDEPHTRRIRGRAEPVQSWLGKDIMLGSEWDGVYPIAEPHRPQSRPAGGTTAAAKPEEQPAEDAGPVDEAAWDERAQFNEAVADLDTAWAEAVADDVPVFPGAFGDPGEGKIDDYPANHHLFGADDAQTHAYIQLQNELMNEWGRIDDEGDNEGGVVAAAHNVFCRNPLHPGPCKGWKKGLPTATPSTPSPAQAKPKAPARARKAATPGVPATPPVPVKSAVPTPAAPTPAQRVASGDFTGLKQVGPQGGSNPGGVFEAADGSRYYIKAASSEKWAREQAAAAELYRLAGVPTPSIVIGSGTPGLPAGFHTATEIVPGLTAPSTSKKYKDALRSGFAVDAWLADWDIGQHGNAMTTSAGDPLRMDIGGSLRFRARGGSKGAAFGATVGEWTSMRDSKNVSGPLFNGMTDDELIDSAAKVTALTDADIQAVIKSQGLDKALGDLLIQRRDDIKAKAAVLQSQKDAAAAIAAARAAGAPAAPVDHIAVDQGHSLATTVAAQIQAGQAPVALDIYLAAIGAQQGFTATPNVTSSVAIGKMGTAGTHEIIYRGVKASPANPQPRHGRASWGNRQATANMAGVPAKTAKEIHDEFRTGDAHYGTGIYGNGYYFTTGPGTASSYSDKSTGSRIRAAIDKSAKTVDYQTMYNEWFVLMSGLADGDPRKTVFHDVGAYAAARGYDAMTVPQGQRRMGVRSETYYVILNRSILVVSK